MDILERQLLLEQLASSEARLLELVDGLTREQWNFQETPERWSIAENIEHLIVFESFIRGAIQRALETPAEMEKKTVVGAKESLVLGLAHSRSTKLKAREAALPMGTWPDSTELIAELRRTRAQTCVFVSKTDAELRDHFFPHIVFGDLDCYQWLVALGQHGFRHALQIEEIKEHPGYPN